MRGVPASVLRPFAGQLARLVRGGRPADSRGCDHRGCALLRELPACGCGPADPVAAPRPEGSRPSGRGRPPAPESARCPPIRSTRARFPRQRAPLSSLAFPRLNLAEAGRPGAPKACP
jgi:hypothetical protein